MKYLIKYDATNSGGGWWLSDEDWYKLEENGWKVDWYKDRNDGFGSNGRFLGTLAQHAEKEFNSIREAIEEFELFTGQTLSDEGCNCCGSPHSFTVKNNQDDTKEYIYGADFIDYMNIDDKEKIRRLRR